jgi:hypothetical protein
MTGEGEGALEAGGGGGPLMKLMGEEDCEL